MQITPAHIARIVGIDTNTARRFIGESFPKTTGKRCQHRFDEARLQELVALCQSKRKRICRNAFNSTQTEQP